jgi:cell division protein FtsI (penicillin-binding protein 3)
LEYLHVPRDLDVKDPQRDQAIASAKEGDVEEGSQHIGEPLQVDNTAAATTSASAAGRSSAPAGASLNVRHPTDTETTVPIQPPSAAMNEQSSNAIASASQGPAPLTQNGVVVVPVESGVAVPSFLGKPLRSAVEIAQQSGVEIDAVGTGVAREQWPSPGSRLASGQRITVRFAH